MKFEVIIFLLLFSTVLLGDSYNKLVNAIRHNNYNSVQKVLEENVDVNKTKWGVTPLYIAVHFDRCEMILPLIKKGADVSKGNVSIVRVLVEAGADVTIPNKYGKTAIEEAQESGYEEIVQILANQH